MGSKQLGKVRMTDLFIHTGDADIKRMLAEHGIVIQRLGFITEPTDEAWAEARVRCGMKPETTV